MLAVLWHLWPRLCPHGLREPTTLPSSISRCEPLLFSRHFLLHLCLLPLLPGPCSRCIPPVSPSRARLPSVPSGKLRPTAALAAHTHKRPCVPTWSPFTHTDPVLGHTSSAVPSLGAGPSPVSVHLSIWPSDPLIPSLPPSTALKAGLPAARHRRDTDVSVVGFAGQEILAVFGDRPNVSSHLF